MAACPSCSNENPEASKFCSECGSPLDAAPARPVAEERKVVSALFCDLVGFTATSESADPEDVDRMLAAYFAMARKQIEGHGGVVEKFIGDAVVGVFGVPATHEDDPERAVRAGLRIAEDAEGLEALGGTPLRLRVGINTGEALVRLGVTPSSGEGFLAGDAINTASRIQSVAPEMGVAVGLATYEATAVVFDYEELEPAMLKGKSEPVRVFHARSPLVRLGTDLSRTDDSPYVGRTTDLAMLKGLFAKSVETDSVQFVTVMGEPGIGKSRIVAELLVHAQAREPRLTWRQGRCLPYGDGVTFWALGEIIKAHAGILETDDSASVAAKLGNAVPEGPDHEWICQRLLPLVGIDATSLAEREELFAAWRTFLQSVAEHGPTVLVFEDLHWADDAMLAFLEHLADRAGGVSLLLLATARPELFERHPDFARGLHNVHQINLAPLSDAETAELCSRLLDASEVPDELHTSVLERAEGNPLYVEEFLRLLKDQGMLVQDAGTWDLRAGAALPLPGSIQSLIAARLDTLSHERKAMLSDAAVVGKVFWAGAVAQMGDRTLEEVSEAMGELSRKELVRLSRRSSMRGEAEYAFWHVLARDVAYGQLPRASRASRHVAAARWIESRQERVEDIADVLAYHYATALELARAARQTEQAAELEAPALRFLSLAGERALGLDAAAALSNLERALALAPEGHPGRPEALARFGDAANQAGHHTEAAEALEEAIASFRARGDLPAAARAMITLSIVSGPLGDPRRWTLPAEALALLEPLGPSRELVEALTEFGHAETLQGRSEEGVQVAERALVLAEELGLSRPARALGLRGMARANLGDPGGLQDYREAIVLASVAGQGREVGWLHNTLGCNLWAFEGPAAALEVLRDGITFARARGLTERVDITTQSALDALVDTGGHDEVLEVAADMAERLEASRNVVDLAAVRANQARILALRGQGEQVAVLEWLESAARESEDPHIVVCGLGSSVFARAVLGQDGATAELLTEIEEYPRARETGYYAPFLPAMVRTALGIGEPALAERLLAGLEPRYPYAEHALVAAKAAFTEARGDREVAADAYADAADRWERFGVVPEQAFALLGQGRCLLGISRPTEAVLVLQHAREIFERLQATPALAETDALLQQSTVLSS